MANSNSGERGSSGIKFVGALTLIFVVAKLLEIVTWSWWLVFLPVLIVPAIFLAILVIGGIFTLLAVIGVGILEGLDQ